MTTIWIITQGEYSSYHIEAAFSTKEMAEEYIKRVTTEDMYYKPGIEEYELDDVDGSWLNGDTHLWYVRFKPGCADVSNVYKQPGKPVESIDWHHTMNGAVYYLNVLADTQERAIKVAMERRAQDIAGNLPGE